MNSQSLVSKQQLLYACAAVGEIAAELKSTRGSEPVQLDPHLYEYFNKEEGFLHCVEETLSKLIHATVGIIYDETLEKAYIMAFEPVDPHFVAEQPLLAINKDFDFDNPQPVQLDSKTKASRAAACGLKKPPRPMNCWMLFRDQQHKLIKAAHPDMSVQDISSICSEAWKRLEEHEKDVWRAEAARVKELHRKKYPDYKYAPRKPGEKKKRQSRKAMEATRAATIAAATIAESATPRPSEASLFDFNAFPPMQMQTTLPNPFAAAAAAADPLNFTLEDATRQVAAEALEMEPKGPFDNELGQAELWRQNRLEAEFQMDYDWALEDFYLMTAANQDVVEEGADEDDLGYHGAFY